MQQTERTLFDAVRVTGNVTPEVRQAAEEGMSQAAEHANPDWQRFMLRRIQAVATRLTEFTTDDVYEEAERFPDRPTTHNNSALGCLMKEARKLGYIQLKMPKTMRPSKRKSSHGRGVYVWESRLIP